MFRHPQIHFPRKQWCAFNSALNVVAELHFLLLSVDSAGLNPTVLRTLLFCFANPAFLLGSRTQVSSQPLHPALNSHNSHLSIIRAIRVLVPNLQIENDSERICVTYLSQDDIERECVMESSLCNFEET